MSDYAKHPTSLVYDILGRYITADDYDASKEDNTTALDFLSQVAHVCTEYEALYLYLLVVETLPDYRWKQYLRRAHPSFDDGQRRAFLEAYLEATSQSFPTLLRMLFSKCTKASALSISAMEILQIGVGGGKRISIWKPGTTSFGICVKTGC